jgi:GTPase SAR1 family protein
MSGVEEPTPTAGPSGSDMNVDKKPPITIITIGMAGSGKTTFVQRINSYLRSTPSPSTGSPRAPYVINLDPAVASVPFETNIDIRDTIDYREVMKQCVNLA